MLPYLHEARERERDTQKHKYNDERLFKKKKMVIKRESGKGYEDDRISKDVKCILHFDAASERRDWRNHQDI